MIPVAGRILTGRPRFPVQASAEPTTSGCFGMEQQGATRVKPICQIRCYPAAVLASMWVSTYRPSLSYKLPSG